MSTSKQVQPKTQKTAVDVNIEDAVELPSGGLKAIEVTSLEFDDQYEADTDPYNRTGSHFVAALRRKQD